MAVIVSPDFSLVQIIHPPQKIYPWNVEPYYDWIEPLSKFSHPLIVCTFYDSGKIEKMWNWCHGYPHGVLLGWWENGQLAEKSFYFQGKFHGPYLSWHSNGQMWESYQYEHGRKVGDRKKWTSQGRLMYSQSS